LQTQTHKVIIFIITLISGSLQETLIQTKSLMYRRFSLKI